MKKTRKHFSQDYLLKHVRETLSKTLKIHMAADSANGSSTIDCIMSGLAIFTFKYPSLLSFEQDRNQNRILSRNLQRLFGIHGVLSDTAMRYRLDRVSPQMIRRGFTKVFTLLQRGNILENFQFMQGSYLVSLDGTGYFSSNNIHCEQCCVKESKKGKLTYYHQMLSAALVHYNQKVVYPFAPEPILKQDGIEKNDCERNAAKRWLEEFRREHPHLPVTIVADGLSANQPFVELLEKHRMHYILVCKDDDHKYLVDWINAADSEDAPCIEIDEPKTISKYQYMHDVPLNGRHKKLVNVLIYWEHDKKSGKIRKWMWITDYKITPQNVKTIMQGGRARWKIENETFNTLKNQGYNFEHNYGHGHGNLSTTMAFLMMLAFFIDQVLQGVNKLFCLAYLSAGSKRVLWERMRNYLLIADISAFENMYAAIHAPPQQPLLSI